MKIKYLIVGLFTVIMLLVPITSAFEMPLSNEDKVELRTLINNENINNKETLNDIIVYNDTSYNLALDLDEVERIYEHYLLTGDESVINSESWAWVVNRLGWIYITIEQVVILYNTGMALFYEIIKGASAVQAFFNGIQAFRAAWQVFKAKPLSFLNIKNLISSTIDLLDAAINLLEYVTQNALKEAIQIFADQVQEFRDFLNSNPWLKPITIKGNVTGFDDSVTISVKSDSVTTTGYYELNYTTYDKTMPWFVHNCEITATYQDKTDTKNMYAFSMGIIEEDYVPSDFNVKSKQIETSVFVKLSFLLKQLLKDRFHIFDDIIKMQDTKSTFS